MQTAIRFIVITQSLHLLLSISFRGVCMWRAKWTRSQKVMRFAGEEGVDQSSSKSFSALYLPIGLPSLFQTGQVVYILTVEIYFNLKGLITPSWCQQLSSFFFFIPACCFKRHHLHIGQYLWAERSTRLDSDTVLFIHETGWSNTVVT